MDSDTQPAYADAETRRLTLSKLAEYLETHQSTITEQWLLAVRRDPAIASAHRLTHQQLVDHLPELYRECCAFLRTRDAAALVEDAKADAKEHGGIRWQEGYEIDELIRELEAFRRVLAANVSRYAETDARFKGPVEVSANALLHQFFGEVTVNSVAQYVQEQQAVVHSYTQKLEVANLELGRANSNLQVALSERQRLTAVIAHEVRNFLQGLAHTTKLWDQQAEDGRALTYAQAQLRDMEDLLTQLLDHSTLIANREPLTTVEFEPAALHSELLRAYGPAAQQRGLTLNGDCSAAPARVYSDRLKIKQIAANLLSNSLKFTTEGNVSLVFAAVDATRWTIHISDTGPGLSADAAQRLFGGIVSNTEVVPRGGIGLAITKDLVELLGGSIQVVTRSGAGTLIAVTLPTGVDRAASPSSELS